MASIWLGFWTQEPINSSFWRFLMKSASKADLKEPTWSTTILDGLI